MKTAIKLFGEKGKIIRLWHGSRLSVVLADPRDVEVSFSLQKLFCYFSNL